MEKKTKIILIGLSVVAVGTGGYFLYRHLNKDKSSDAADKLKEAVSSSSTTHLSESTSSSKSSSSSSVDSGFPLKKGSRGTLVESLQKALMKSYGSGILPKYGADGIFGSETENALRSKGLSTVIDSDTFTQIVLASGSSSDGTTPTNLSSAASISNALHAALTKRSLPNAIEALRQIDNVDEYSAVNTVFKETKIGLVSKTIVTALLDKFYYSAEKKALNEEFYRIGLKYNGSQWSLSGLQGLSNQLLSLEKTKVWNSQGQSINVPKDTILGEYLDASDGVTQFETLDGKRLFVSTNAIKYAS